MVRVFTVVFVAAMPGGSGKRVAPQHFHSSVFFTVSQPPSSPLSSILDVHKLLQPNKLQTYTAFAVFICPVANGLVLTPDDSVIKNDTFFFSSSMWQWQKNAKNEYDVDKSVSDI